MIPKYNLHAKFKLDGMPLEDTVLAVASCYNAIHKDSPDCHLVEFSCKIDKLVKISILFRNNVDGGSQEDLLNSGFIKVDRKKKYHIKVTTEYLEKGQIFAASLLLQLKSMETIKHSEAAIIAKSLTPFRKSSISIVVENSDCGPKVKKVIPFYY